MRVARYQAYTNVSDTYLFCMAHIYHIYIVLSSSQQTFGHVRKWNLSNVEVCRLQVRRLTRL